MVSRRQIAFESKAQADAKAQHTFKYVSILKRPATQLSDARWGFETTSAFFILVLHPYHYLHLIDVRIQPGAIFIFFVDSALAFNYTPRFRLKWPEFVPIGSRIFGGERRSSGQGKTGPFLAGNN